MKITDVQTVRFKYPSKVVRDSEGHRHPGPEHEAAQTLLKIITDEGVEGYSFGGNAQVIQNVIKPILVGEDPFYRERIWQDMFERQRMNSGTLTNSVLSAVDLALWDLAGRALNQPVYKLLGGYRTKIPAYASTMCGDDLQGGLATPQDYANFAQWCLNRGYQAFKLHTWHTPYPGAPNPKRDIEACAAVRKAVGPHVPLMLDPYHFYDREASLYLATEAKKLDFYWMEEPMDERSMSSYIWLTQQTDLPICGPENADGSLFVRAEWIKHKACAISRGGVNHVGGLTPLMKTIHLAEAFGMRCEPHSAGAANLHALCAMANAEYYERGMLHPFLNYDEPSPWLHELEDPMDNEGFVHVSTLPGLGQNINWDYIEKNKVT